MKERNPQMTTLIQDVESSIKYPVLVYGTLRPGCGNYRNFLQGKTVQEETVKVSGFAMHGRRGFPYLLLGEREITGTLVYIAPDFYDRTLRSLDSLEGFYGLGQTQNHYDRKLVTFTHNGTERKAWVYVANTALTHEIQNSLPVIESGDWVLHVSDFR